MLGIKDENEIMKVAKSISEIVPNFCGVTLGGSRANRLNDELSDVEMYFYSESGIPSVEDIDTCLNKLEAQHKRCESFLWNEYPWGPHSFFVMDGLYFEIGYRIVSDIEKKIDAYLEGNVVPTTDCHDLGLGYVYSGLAASVCSEMVLISKGFELERLKTKASMFPTCLQDALKVEFLDTAQSMLEGKMYSAAERNDIFLYEVLASRVIRSLMVMAFSISHTHFPGDKWNAVLLSKTKWENKYKFLDILKEHFDLNDVGDGNLLKKREKLITAYNLIKTDLVLNVVD